MSPQELYITLPGELGCISISTRDEFNVSSTGDAKFIRDYYDKIQLYDIISNNIPRYDINDNFTQIMYLFKEKCVDRIYLIEECEYILKYIPGNIRLDNDALFPFLKQINGIRLDSTNGREFFLNFKSYVGKAFIDIESCGLEFKVQIEVRSRKINYDEEYTVMINDLAELTSNLVYNINPSVYQSSNFKGKSRSDYDYFLLITYVFSPDNLPRVFEYLSRNLNNTLRTFTQQVSVSYASNIGFNELSNIISNPRDLIETDKYKFISSNEKQYIPLYILEEKLEDSVDTPENRFYKYFLELLEDIILSLLDRVEDGYIKDKLNEYYDEINYYLSQSYFKEISKIDYVPFNSQVLQKKEGYRDILKYYIMLEYGNKLSWNEVNNTIKGYQKRLSEIYEIWQCFQLLDIIEDISNPNHKEYEYTNETITNLIDNNDETFIINLKEKMKFNPVKYMIDNTVVTITLMYNKHFTRKLKENHSYSIYLRPDYTIKLEYENKTRFIHFDAKYKTNIIYKEDTFNKTFKNQDIAKMHTYKDAIPNTICAYILYPGEKIKHFKKNKHNRFEGVGALPLRPKRQRDKKRIKRFIENIIKYEVGQHDKEDISICQNNII